MRSREGPRKSSVETSLQIDSNSLIPCFSNCHVHVDYLGIWLECRFWFNRSEDSLRLCLSHKLPVGADAVGLSGHTWYLSSQAQCGQGCSWERDLQCLDRGAVLSEPPGDTVWCRYLTPPSELHLLCHKGNEESKCLWTSLRVWLDPLFQPDKLFPRIFVIFKFLVIWTFDKVLMYTEYFLKKLLTWYTFIYQKVTQRETKKILSF